MTRNIRRISTSSLQVSTPELLHTLFYQLDTGDLQELYDFTGGDAHYLRNQLNLDITTRKFACKLFDNGIALSPDDLRRARVSQSEEIEKSVARFSLGDSFDLEEMMQDAAESNLDPTIFNKMDFRELPNPGNIIEWITGRQFLNASPFPRQVQCMLGLLEEWCPYCSDRDFVRDIHLSPYLGEDGVHKRPWTTNEILERVTLTHNGVCPKCRATYGQMLADPTTPHKAPNELIACFGQRCVAGDTLLFTDRGILEIESLVPKNPRQDTFYPLDDIRTASGTPRVLHIESSYYSGIRRAVKVTTDLGYSITGSEIHPLRVLQNGKPVWKKIPELTLNDVAIISVGDNVWGSNTLLETTEFIHHHGAHQDVTLPQEMTPNLARLLGYLVSDGSYNGQHIQQRVRMSISDPDILEDFEDLVLENFNLPVSIQGDRSSLMTGKEGPCVDASFCSVDVRKFLLEACGLDRKTARSKSIPSSILQAPRHLVVEFLTGLYEGDGSVFVGKNHHDHYIDYTSVSKKLAQQVHMILLNMGITASFREGDTYVFGGGEKTGESSYSVRITNPKDMRTFLEEVRWASTHRKNQSAELLERVTADGEDAVVYGSFDIMRRIFQQMFGVVSDKEIQTKLHGYNIWMNKRWAWARQKGFRSGFTRRTLRRMVSALESENVDLKILKAALTGRIRLLSISRIEEAGDIPLYDLHVPQYHRFTGNGFINHNSGKTRMAEMIMTYVNARYQLLTPTPQQHFGEDMTQQFTAMFTAIDLAQSADTLWGNYHIRIQTAPWYRTYHDWLDYHGKKLGIELYRIMDTYHSWAPTLLQDRLKPPFAKAMRGRTGYMMGVDEIGMFSKGENAIRANADEVFQSMNNTLFTLRQDIDALNRRGIYTPPAPMICISSPWELLDKIMRLVRGAAQAPRRVAYHYATWEVNPKIFEDSDQVRAEFAEDPVKARRDWGAVPPLSDDPFHTNQSAIDALPTRSTPIFKQQLKTVATRSGKHYVYAIPSQMMPDRTTPRIMTIDSGESNNSFALSVWSVIKAASPVIAGADDEDLMAEEEDEDVRVILQALRDMKEEETENDEPQERGMSTYLKLDGVIEVMPFTDPTTGDKHRVHYKKMYDLCIVPIVRSFNILCLVSDRWNMASIIHGLQEEEHVVCHQYTLTWKDFVQFRDKTNKREILLHQPEKPYDTIFQDFEAAIRDSPNLHLLVQMKTVRKVGRQVVKPKGGTDDLYRTLALAWRFALNDNPKDVAVDPKGIPYLKLLETAGKAQGSRQGVGLVMLRRDQTRQTITRDTTVKGVGSYKSNRNLITRNKMRGRY